MIVVDSSVWIDYLRGIRTQQTDRLNLVGSRRLVLVGDLVLCEVLQGLRNEHEARRVEALLQRFAFGRMGGYDVAVEAARIYRTMHARGITIRKTIDLLIATFCLLGSHDLLHADRDFDVFAREFGLKVV